MIYRKIDAEPSALEKEIDNVLKETRRFKPETPEYAQMIRQLQKLHSMKTKEAPRPSTVHPDTIAMIIGNLLGIALILEFERANIITSKALGFVSKLR